LQIRRKKIGVRDHNRNPAEKNAGDHNRNPAEKKLENFAGEARETPTTGEAGNHGQQDVSAEDGFAGLTDTGGGEDAMGAFLDPIDGILVTKDGKAPSKVGRQRTERLAKQLEAQMKAEGNGSRLSAMVR
jgi:hypothetical protein